MESLLSQGTGLCSKPQVQCRGTNLIGVGISHGSVILLTADERIRVWIQQIFVIQAVVKAKTVTSL